MATTANAPLPTVETTEVDGKLAKLHSKTGVEVHNNSYNPVPYKELKAKYEGKQPEEEQTLEEELAELCSTADLAELCKGASSMDRPITNFDDDVKKAEGFTTKRDCNLKMMMQKRIGEKIESFRLGRPAINHDWQDHLMVGTDDPNAEDHFLLCLSTKRLTGHIDKNPIVHHVQVNEPIRDIKHVTNNSTLVALETGFHVFKVNQDKEIVHGTGLYHAHSAPIREMSINPFERSQVASGGLDGTVSVWNVVDCAKGMYGIRSIKMPDVVSSVKWGDGQENKNVVGVTTDGGYFFLLDDDQELKKPVFQYRTNKAGLYSHCFTSEYNFLLGFDDGTIRSGDIRMGHEDIVAETVDPFCQSISDMDYSREHRAMVTSGFTNFGVWNHNPAEQSAQIWSQKMVGVSSAQIDPENPDFVVNARFLSDGCTVVTTDSTGMVGIYRQDFTQY